METTVDNYISDIDNGFSWERVMRIAEFYFPALRMQMILYPVVAIVLYSLTLLGHYTLGDTVGILSGGLCSTVLSCMFYFAPVALTRRDTRIVETMLPATCAEKSVFLLGYFFVVIPVLLYGVYYGVGSAVQWIFGLYNVLFSVNVSVIIQNTALVYASNVMSAIVPTITCLWAVLVTARSRALMGIVWSVVSLISLSMISGIGTLIMMFATGFFDAIMKNPAVAESPEAMESMGGSMLGSMTSILLIVGALAMIYNIFAVWRVWRLQAYRQL